MSDEIICGDSLKVLGGFPAESVDLVLTSPPYDNLRDYNGFTVDFEGIARELYRVLKPGGVIVWVVGDQTKDGSESGTSFKQALFFKEIGLNLHDTMIYLKDSCPFPEFNRYYPSFEYMFVFSKGKPKTTNLIADKKNKKAGDFIGTSTQREKDGTTRPISAMKKDPERKIKDFSVRTNVWSYSAGFGKTTNDKAAYEHPAMFPEALAKDHILSWSNEGDLVLDPFNGSGTTTKCAKYLRRSYIGIDISERYCEIARQRLLQEMLF